MYVAETEQSWWYQIPYDKVDILIMGPGGMQKADGGKFGLLPSLRAKFNKVVTTARKANPGIKILVSQWWGNGQEKVWGSSLSQLTSVDAYALSVASFVDEYGLDGYDIDYESSNVVSSFPALAASLRRALDAKKAGLLFTISPASTRYLTRESLTHVDLINMQSYAGGRGINVKSYTNLGFPSSAVLYGICPESHCSGASVETACATVKADNLGGIHLWRLNSDNHGTEDSVQGESYQRLHTGKCGAISTQNATGAVGHPTLAPHTAPESAEVLI